MPTENPLGRLAALLRAGGAVPEVTPERWAPSTVHDLEYRVVILAMAFQQHATKDRFSPRPRIQARRIKFLQFVAIRPWLVPVVREWSDSRRSQQRGLDTEEDLKRGFIGDTMHDDVMDFVVAAGVLSRDENFVVLGPQSALIFDLYLWAAEHNLFRAESAALHELKGIVITNDMLEGW